MELFDPEDKEVKEDGKENPINRINDNPKSILEVFGSLSDKEKELFKQLLGVESSKKEETGKFESTKQKKILEQAKIKEQEDMITTLSDLNVVIENLDTSIIEEDEKLALKEDASKKNGQERIFFLVKKLAQLCEIDDSIIQLGMENPASLEILKKQTLDAITRKQNTKTIDSVVKSDKMNYLKFYSRENLKNLRDRKRGLLTA